MGFFDWLLDVGESHDMTKDYYGKHGEFDSNDDDRAYNEEMYAMRSSDRHADLGSHFGWEHEMNYDSDGYNDEEDW